MRTASVPTRNNQTVELFLERHEKQFELWLVGRKDNQRVILNHYLTHDDLEARLRYSKSVLLNWELAGPNALPESKSEVALQEEQTIDCGTFWDADDLSDHLGGVLQLDRDPAALEAANTALVGAWGDGGATLVFGADAAFQCSVAETIKSGFLEMLGAVAPEEWRLSDDWELRLMNRKTRRTERRLVHRVSEVELHLAGEGNCIALVLKRKTV